MAGVNRKDYPSRSTEAARRVMLELVRLLGEYRNDAVIVGGWVPKLLMPGKGQEVRTSILRWITRRSQIRVYLDSCLSRPLI